MFSNLLVMDGKNNLRVDPFPVRFRLIFKSSKTFSKLVIFIPLVHASAMAQEAEK